MELDTVDLLRVYHSPLSFPALLARSANRPHTSAVSSSKALTPGSEQSCATRRQWAASCRPARFSGGDAGGACGRVRAPKASARRSAVPFVHPEIGRAHV